MPRAPQARGKVNEELVDFIKDLFTDRPIAFHPMLARALGSTTGAIFLSQLLYWMPRSRGGWVYKTRDQIYDETSLTRREQESARAALRTAKVLKEKRAGVPARLYFSVDWEQLALLLRGARPRLPDPDDADESEEPDLPGTLLADEGPVPPSWSKTYQLEGRNRANKLGVSRPTISETTTEITSGFDDDDARETSKKPSGRAATTRPIPPMVLPLEGVAKQLHAFGVAPETALHLADTYPEEHILYELEFTQYLVETRSHLVERNPAGFLIRAIEGAYSATPGFRTAAQRQVEERERLEHRAREEAELQAAEAAYTQAREQTYQQLREQFPQQLVTGTTLSTDAVWQQVLEELRPPQTTALKHRMWLEPAVLVSCDQTEAILAAMSSYHVEQLQLLSRPIALALTHVVGRPLSCRVQLAHVLLPSCSPDAPGNEANVHPTAGPDQGTRMPLQASQMTQNRSERTGSREKLPSTPRRLWGPRQRPERDEPERGVDE